MLEFLKTGNDDSREITVRGQGADAGRGFRLLSRNASPRLSPDAWRNILVAGSIITAGLCILIALAARGTDGDIMIVTAALLTLCGFTVYDIFSRRAWEARTAAQIRELIRNHDRLVHEAARNRTDIVIMKEGLADIAHAVEDQGRRLPPSSSVEAAMIGAMAQRLGALGQRPRAELGTPHDAGILQMEMNPPAARPEPLDELDSELAPDFGSLSEETMQDIVQDAVRKDRIDLFMQPVVALPQRRVKMMEIFARIHAGAGAYLPAQRYITLARRANLVASIDNLLLLRCLHMLRESSAQSNVIYMLNISSATLHDRKFMGDLVTFLTNNRAMASRLVFEMPQRELVILDDALLPVLDGLAQLGCRFSMDRVRDRVIDIGLMKSRHVRFIKIDAQWLLKEGGSQTGFSRIIRLKKQLDAAGIDLIVEKIEDEKTLRELLDFNVDFGQGYLFGKPDHHVAYKDMAA